MFKWRAARSGGGRLGVGVGPRPDRLVAGPEGVDQRGSVVEVLERAEREQRVLDLEPPDQVLEVDEHHLASVHHDVAGLDVSVEQVRAVRRIPPERVEGALRSIDRLADDRPVASRRARRAGPVAGSREPGRPSTHRPAGRAHRKLRARARRRSARRPGARGAHACTAARAAHRPTRRAHTFARRELPGAQRSHSANRPWSGSPTARPVPCLAGARQPTPPRPPRSRRREYEDSGSRARRTSTRRPPRRERPC